MNQIEKMNEGKSNTVTETQLSAKILSITSDLPVVEPVDLKYNQYFIRDCYDVYYTLIIKCLTTTEYARERKYISVCGTPGMKKYSL